MYHGGAGRGRLEGVGRGRAGAVIGSGGRKVRGGTGGSGHGETENGEREAWKRKRQCRELTTKEGKLSKRQRRIGDRGEKGARGSGQGDVKAEMVAREGRRSGRQGGGGEGHERK